MGASAVVKTLADRRKAEVLKNYEQRRNEAVVPGLFNRGFTSAFCLHNSDFSFHHGTGTWTNAVHVKIFRVADTPSRREKRTDAGDKASFSNSLRQAMT
jgi:hypothetical protein